MHHEVMFIYHIVVLCTLTNCDNFTIVVVITIVIVGGNKIP